MKNEKLFKCKRLQNIVKKRKAVLKKNEKNVPKYLEIKGFLSFFILHELEGKQLSGDDLAKVIGERKKTVLTPGTIYPALKRLRRQKLIKYRRNGRKKVYFLTSDGKRELRALYFVFREFFHGLKNKIR